MQKGCLIVFRKHLGISGSQLPPYPHVGGGGYMGGWAAIPNSLQIDGGGGQIGLCISRGGIPSSPQNFTPRSE
jgi:hypothetical protein